MPSHRTALRASVAVLGAGASLVLAVALATPAAAVEGDFAMPNTTNCAAIQKIELRYDSDDGRYHDYQGIDPTRTDGKCEFLIWDSANGRPVYDSFDPWQSPWVYDGPGHSVRTQIIDRTTPAFSFGIWN